MSDTFDWFDLLIDVICKRIEEGDPAAAAYLRTRIEAAFVPNRTVELLGECMENLTARAEAAEAENARLRVFAEHYARQPCSCGVMQGAVTCGPCNARQALGDEHGK